MKPSSLRPLCSGTLMTGLRDLGRSFKLQGRKRSWRFSKWRTEAAPRPERPRARVREFRQPETETVSQIPILVTEKISDFPRVVPDTSGTVPTVLSQGALISDKHGRLVELHDTQVHVLLDCLAWRISHFDVINTARDPPKVAPRMKTTSAASTAPEVTLGSSSSLPPRLCRPLRRRAAQAAVHRRPLKSLAV